ncbi:MAG: threonine/serine dehydratase [Bacillota bacterium]|nr:threonine/serine dehydratase [Bacillota bacterium]
MPAEWALTELASGAQQIWKAQKRIQGLVDKTPLIYSDKLSKKFEAGIYLKYEFLHPTGSFKLRGAASKILSLEPEERQRGVATFSTGNHGLAVAYTAHRLGIPASIFISERVPETKVNNLKKLGVKLFVHGRSQDEAEDYCYDKSRKENWTVIKPFDDPLIIAGQGTIGLEILSQLPELNTVIVPLSGGGLISGIALALKCNLPDVRVIGVSMMESAVMYQSLQAGHPVKLEEHNTLADSLLGGIGLDNQYTFPLVEQFVDHVILVSEEEIARGMAYLYSEHRIAVEGAAATTVACLRKSEIVKPADNVALILSGNNVDTSSFHEVVSAYL